MEELQKLCARLALPEEVTAAVCAFGAECPYQPEALWAKLSNAEGERALRNELTPDENGLKMLACMLLAGLHTRELYRAQGMGEDVFYDTFGCFPRFVGEHLKSFGRYGFDRSFWTHRQVGMKLFRIGELEYEMTGFHGEKVLSVHIPSSAKLTPETCRDSYRRAAGFFRAHYPEYAGRPFICESWLLSPALKELLPGGSNILAFQGDYRLCEIHPEDSEFLSWVYGRADIPPRELPEDTTLRRNMKAFLLGGGKVGAATGVLSTKEGG